MSKNSITARHRATPSRSIVLEGLSVTAKSNLLNMGKSGVVVAAASGLLFGIGAPAHAGTHAPDSGTANVQVQASAPAPAPAPAAAAPAARVHTVVSGDTLGAISARYGVSLNSVFSANGMSMATIIYPGNQIKIPGAGTAAPAPAPARAAAPAPAPAVRVAAASAPAPAAASSSVGAAILGSAYSQLGVTQDCTAMVEKALRSVGKRVGDLAPGQFFQYGSVVGTPAPGDLVITAGHVGVYAGNGQVVSGGVDGYKTQVHSISWLTGYSFVRVA